MAAEAGAEKGVTGRSPEKELFSKPSTTPQHGTTILASDIHHFQHSPRVSVVCQTAPSAPQRMS